jgi:phosphatidate cytidylyltransferase
MSSDPASVDGAPSAATVPGGGAAPTSKGGRNLPAALAVGLLLGGVALGSLFLGPWAFLVLAAAAVLGGHWELRAAFGTAGVVIPAVSVALGAIAILVAATVGGPEAMLGAVGLTVVGVLVARLRRGADGYLRDASGAVFVTAYLSVAGGFAMLLASAEDGAFRIIAWLVTVIASDVGGYAVGVLIGRHPMAPTISPKKSWEGFGGSVTACLVAGAATVVWLLDGPLVAGLALGVSVVLSATLGDLVESLLKRDLGVKDMGSLLPGHGGIMDRLDSIALSAPVAWVVLSLLVPVAA